MSAPIDLISHVHAVTVYRRGAMVTRRAELLRGDGPLPARVQLAGLPLSLDDSSIRVELDIADSDAELAPVAADLRVILSVPPQDSQLAPPSNAELDQATLELELIGAELEQLLSAEARLARLEPAGRGQPERGKAPAPSPTAARLELLRFRRDRAERLAEQIATQREREREAQERLANLRERERLASTQRNVRTHELRKAAVLTLDHAGGQGLAERVQIKLHYFVPGARWAPAYTIRLDSSMREASLELRALVGQASGEDWSKVALTLSTAAVQQWTELPKLESQRIGRRQPPPGKTGWRPPPVGAEGLYADYDRGLGPPRVERPSPPKPKRAPAMPMLPGMPPPSPSPGSMISRSAMMPMSSGGPPAPPPPSSAAPSRTAAAPEQSKRGGLVGAMFEGAADTFGAVSASFAGGGGPQSDLASPSDSPSPSATAPELLAGRELLDYGRLRLLSPASPKRGSLQRIDTRALYEQLSGAGVPVDQAMQALELATARAQTLDHEAAPAGHRWPVSEAGFDYAYLADAPCDLRSDGQLHALAIDLREAPATPRYIAVPRETPAVFRIVALRNPLAAPLLPGPADVYVGGKFALSSALELTPIGGRIELGLGVEQAIKIARNVSFSEDSSGMFKRQLELRHTLEIELANHLATPATVEVRERLPVAASAQADDIQIEIGLVKPPWDDYDPQELALEGGRRWVIEVPANAKRELAASWTVSIPINHELVGGNRREV